MKIIAPENLCRFFDSLAGSYDIRIPILLPDGGRSLGRIADGPLAMHGGALPAKPTAFFFPQEELVFTARDSGAVLPQRPGKPLFITGFTPRDLLCLRFIDRFFAAGWRDDLYFRLRQDAVIAGVSGYCGRDGALIKPSTGECDLEFVYNGNDWLLLAHSATGRAMAEFIADEAPIDALHAISRAAAEMPADEEELIATAAAIVQTQSLPDSFWEEIGARCIQCSGCNLVCPTCTCFGVRDWRFCDRVERSRIWDSCQLAGFMKEAGGHNPLGTEALRTRRRIHHKLAADPERWGEISCFLCGRCDKVCPTGIGIFSVAREIIARFGA